MLPIQIWKRKHWILHKHNPRWKPETRSKHWDRCNSWYLSTKRKLLGMVFWFHNRQNILDTNIHSLARDTSESNCSLPRKRSSRSPCRCQRRNKPSSRRKSRTKTGRIGRFQHRPRHRDTRQRTHTPCRRCSHRSRRRQICKRLFRCNSLHCIPDRIALPARRFR